MISQTRLCDTIKKIFRKLCQHKKVPVSEDLPITIQFPVGAFQAVFTNSSTNYNQIYS